jgi:hypothetical protein
MTHDNHSRSTISTSSTARGRSFDSVADMRRALQMVAQNDDGHQWFGNVEQGVFVALVCSGLAFTDGEMIKLTIMGDEMLAALNGAAQ